MKTGILSLGTRPDANIWENGCKNLGFDVPLPIKKPNPSFNQLKGFFRQPVQWLFFAGHFLERNLYNDAHTVNIRFYSDRINLTFDGQDTILRKGTSDFQLDREVRLILWGGCSTLGDTRIVSDLRGLFGAHVMIGFKRMTGYKMVSAMLDGGNFIKQPFFTRVGNKVDEPTELRDAWMGAAQQGYAGSDNESHFSAIDTDGQEWILESKKIKRGRRMF